MLHYLSQYCYACVRIWFSWSFRHEAYWREITGSKTILIFTFNRFGVRYLRLGAIHARIYLDAVPAVAHLKWTLQAMLVRLFQAISLVLHQLALLLLPMTLNSKTQLVLDNHDYLSVHGSRSPKVYIGEFSYKIEDVEL